MPCSLQGSVPSGSSPRPTRTKMAEGSKIVASIYSNRTFKVRDAGSTSTEHVQHFGICQGCPLSPFLFAIVMTILLYDARKDLEQNHVNTAERLPVSELLYADDTLVVDVDATRAQEFMNCIGKAGMNYGLGFNWKKLEVLPMRCEAIIRKLDNDSVKQKDSIVYLGAVLSRDASIGPELSRRIGAAEGEFSLLARVWSHCKLPLQKKLRIFEACIMSKLLYSLHTAWLNTVERRKLDAFHFRCLRRIAGIKPSYVSRVSNESVLQTTKQRRASNTLLQRQMLFMGKVARLPDTDATRQNVFSPFSTDLARLVGKRSEDVPEQYGQQKCTNTA